MGLFDTFKKKNNAPAETPVPDTPDPAAKADPRPDVTLEPTVDAAEILRILQERSEGGEIVGEHLVFRHHDLHIFTHFGDMRTDGKSFNVQLLLVAQHPFFDEDLVESVSGVGETPDDAIRKAASNAAAMLPFILSPFDHPGSEILTTTIMGQTYRFHAPEKVVTLHAGEGAPSDLWGLLKDSIPNYLGTKRVYWVRAFSAMVGDVPSCEVRINGSVCADLGDILLEDAVANRADRKFTVSKTLVLLIQDEETYVPCPFTKQEVGEAAFRAFRLFQNIRDEATSRKVQQQIVESVTPHSLGVELMCFLPEITAQQVVRFRDSDCVIPVINRGKPEHELRKTQVRSYGYIEDAVFQYLHKQNPSEDEVRQILAVSGKFHTLSEALENGLKLEDLRLSQLVYFVDENYKVW